jgi:trehalose/maltose hydrolase-like predicted phosphorylase
MHGVTGPNEYENNVNNNWYTNYIAALVPAIRRKPSIMWNKRAGNTTALVAKTKFYKQRRPALEGNR